MLVKQRCTLLGSIHTSCHPWSAGHHRPGTVKSNRNQYDMWSVYMIKITFMSELRIENTSERDLCSCEVTRAVTNKAQKSSEAPTGFEPMTSAIPVRCSTDWAIWSLAQNRSGTSSIYTRYMKRMMWSVYDKDHMSELWIENRSDIFSGLYL